MSTITEPQLANAALGYLNASTITSLDEDTPHAASLSRYWNLCRQAMLREYDWNFARKTTSLTALAGASLTAVEDANYGNAYALPDDFLCARTAQETSTLAKVEYDIRPDALLTDAATVTLTYTRDITEVSTWDATFADAFAVAVAARAAKLITGSDEIAGELSTLLRRDFLAPAKIASATEAKPERGTSSFLPQSELIDARFGGAA